MNRVTINDQIIADPSICHGKPVFSGTRVMVWQVLEMIEVGKSEEEVYEAFPNLPQNAIPSALKYATEKVKETSYIPFPPTHGQDSVYSR